MLESLVGRVPPFGDKAIPLDGCTDKYFPLVAAIRIRCKKRFKNNLR
jgi:hypothetical protein